jgi:hypothetical protein
MAFLLRNISKPKWARYEWMEPGSAPAEALTDLRPTNNALSVWRIEADHSNLSAVLAAFASNRDRLDKLDYALVDETVLARQTGQAFPPPESRNFIHAALCRFLCGEPSPRPTPSASASYSAIKCIQASADTPYAAANASHHDLVELTARKLARFADEIMLVEHLRLSERQVKLLLRTAIAEGAVDRQRLKPSLARDLGES